MFNKKSLKLFTFILIFANILNIFSATPIFAKGKLSNPYYLIKTRENSAVYLIQNKLKYLIKSEQIFLSYDFSWEEVQYVSSGAINQYASASILKNTIDKKYYLLNYQTKKIQLIPNEKIAKEYNYDLTKNMEVSPLDLASWTLVNLVKATDKPQVYYLDGNLKHLIPSAYDFTTLGFSWSDIVTISATDLNYYKNSSDLVAEKKAKEDEIPPEQKEKQEQTPPIDQKIKEDILKVSLSADSPIKQSFAANSKDNHYLTVDLTTYLEEVKVLSLTVKQFSNLLDVNSSLYILDETGKKIGDNTTFGAIETKIKLGAGGLTIPAYTTKKLKFFVNIANTNQSNFDHGIFITAISHNSAQLNATLPIYSAIHSIVNDDNISAKVSIDALLLTTNKENAIIVGQPNQKLAKFKFEVLNKRENVLLKELKLTNRGNLDLTKLKNIKIYTNTGKNSLVSNISKTELFFDLTKQPFTIPQTGKLEITLQADINDGVDYNLDFTIADINAVKLIGEISNFSITPLANGTNDTTYPLGDFINVFHIVAGQYYINIGDNTPKTSIVTNSKNATLIELEIINAGTEAYLSGFDLQINGSKPIRYLQVINKADKSVLGIVDVNRVWNNESTVNLTNPPLIKSRSTLTIALLVDVPGDAKTTDYYQASLKNFRFKTEITTTDILEKTIVQSYKLYASPIIIQVYCLPAPIDTRLISGKTNQIIGSFSLQNGATDTVRVTSITVQPKKGYEYITFENGFERLKINGYSTYTTLGNDSRPYEIPVNIEIDKNQEKRIDLILETKSFVDNKLVNFDLIEIKATRKTEESEAKIYYQDQNLNCGDRTFVSTKLNIAINSTSTNQSLNKDKRVILGEFKMENLSAEDIKVNSLIIAELEDSAGLSHLRGYTNLQLRDQLNGNAISGNMTKPMPYEAGNLLTGFTIKKGQTIIFDITVIANSTTLIGDQMHLYIKDIIATGASSNLSAILNDNLFIADKITVSN